MLLKFDKDELAEFINTSIESFLSLAMNFGVSNLVDDTNNLVKSILSLIKSENVPCASILPLKKKLRRKTNNLNYLTLFRTTM